MLNEKRTELLGPYRPSSYRRRRIGGYKVPNTRTPSTFEIYRSSNTKRKNKVENEGWVFPYYFGGLISAKEYLVRKEIELPSEFRERIYKIKSQYWDVFKVVKNKS